MESEIVKVDNNEILAGYSELKYPMTPIIITKIRAVYFWSVMIDHPGSVAVNELIYKQLDTGKFADEPPFYLPYFPKVDQPTPYTDNLNDKIYLAYAGEERSIERFNLYLTSWLELLDVLLEHNIRNWKEYMQQFPIYNVFMKIDPKLPQYTAINHYIPPEYRSVVGPRVHDCCDDLKKKDVSYYNKRFENLMRMFGRVMSKYAWEVNYEYNCLLMLSKLYESLYQYETIGYSCFLSEMRVILGRMHDVGYDEYRESNWG